MPQSFHSDVLIQLERFIEQSYETVKVLTDRFQGEHMELPSWDELRNNEEFFNYYREHLVFNTKVSQELSKLSSISVEVRRYRLEDVESLTDSGLSITAQRTIKNKIQHYTRLISELRESLIVMKNDTDMRIKFFVSMEYLLSSPYGLGAEQ